MSDDRGSLTPVTNARRLVEERAMALRLQEEMAASHSSVPQRQLNGDVPTSSVYLQQHPTARRRRDSFEERFVDGYGRKYKAEPGTTWSTDGSFDLICELPIRHYDQSLLGAPEVDSEIVVVDIRTQEQFRVIVETSFFKMKQKSGSVKLRKK